VAEMLRGGRNGESGIDSGIMSETNTIKISVSATEANIDNDAFTKKG